MQILDNERRRHPPPTPIKHGRQQFPIHNRRNLMKITKSLLGNKLNFNKIKSQFNELFFSRNKKTKQTAETEIIIIILCARVVLTNCKIFCFC